MSMKQISVIISLRGIEYSSMELSLLGAPVACSLTAQLLLDRYSQVAILLTSPTTTEFNFDSRPR